MVAVMLALVLGQGNPALLRGSAEAASAIAQHQNAARILAENPPRPAGVDPYRWFAFRSAQVKRDELARLDAQQQKLADELADIKKGRVVRKWQGERRHPKSGTIIYKSQDDKEREIAQQEQRLRELTGERERIADEDFIYRPPMPLPIGKGDVGALPSFRVISVAGPSEALVTMGDLAYWIHCSTDDMVDGQAYSSRDYYEATGTKRYQNTAGATKTVIELKPLDDSQRAQLKAYIKEALADDEWKP